MNLNKIWKEILNSDAYISGVLALLTSIILMLYWFIYIIAVSIKQQAITITGTISKEAIAAADMTGFFTFVFMTMSVMFFGLSAYQEYQKKGIKKIIKREGICVIK